MGNNQSNHFPHIPENVTWSLNTIINGKSQMLLSDFFEGRGGCTQAKLRENKVQHLIGSLVELTYGTELNRFNLLMLAEGEGSCLTVTK